MNPNETQAIGRDKGDFQALYDAHADRIYRFCLRLCGGRAADAEDLAQEVFIAAYRGWDRFEGRSSVATWLYRIAIYRWRRMREARGPEAVSLDDGPEPSSMQGDPARVEPERISLERALAALPHALREAFLIVKSEGLKYREAAEALGVPQGTVQSRVHDAALRLRAALREEKEEEDAL